jgi:hypothetical protein
MVPVLLVVGALGMPVTGLLVRPDVRGARHGNEMFVELGRFGWYGYLVLSVVALAVGLVGVRSGTPRGRGLGVGATTALLTLTVVFGTIHVFVVANGMFHGHGKPWATVVATLTGLAAVTALGFARVRLRRPG